MNLLCLALKSNYELLNYTWNLLKKKVMVLTLDPLKSQEKSEQKSNLVITWEALPTNFILEDEPVESTAQPLIAGALRESLELIGYITTDYANCLQFRYLCHRE